MAINPITWKEEEIVKATEEIVATPTNLISKPLTEADIWKIDTRTGQEVLSVEKPVVIEEKTLFTPTWLDAVVDIEEEKKWVTPKIDFNENSVQEAITRQRLGKATDTDKEIIAQYQTKTAFNRAKWLDAFWNNINASTTATDDQALRNAQTTANLNIQDIQAQTKASIEANQRDIDARLNQAQADIQNRGKERMNTLDRWLSFSGFGRSSVAVQKRDEVQQSINQEIAIAQAKAQAEAQLFKAQQEWAEAETISAIQKNISDAATALKKVETENAIAVAKMNQEMWLKAEEALNNFLNTTWIENKANFTWDINKTRELGAWYFVDAEWKLVTDDKWMPIIYKQPEEAEAASKAANVQFVAAKADAFWDIIQPAGYFNKDTQEFTPINFGGNPNQTEFPNNNDMDLLTTKIAEYSQIYKWSPSNPNWVDLAWKKGSAIKTPISWEVIFVWDWWGWGNQVKIKDSSWRIHQFSHLDTSILKEWQFLTRWAMVWTMWNTWNVLKWDWTKPTPEELAQGRWTHLDYTVYDENGKPMSLDVAMSFAWITNTSWTKSDISDAVSKWYTTAAQIQVYKKIIDEWGFPPDLNNKNLTEWQANASWFASRMWDSLDILKQKKDIIKWLNTWQLASYRKAYWTTLWNQFVPPEVQQFIQAERNFIQAQLRKESGAAIPDSEIESFIQTNGILPWDSNEVIDQKFRNMENMLESMILNAWPAWARFKKEDIPAWLDMNDVEFFWDEVKIEFDKADEDFFNNL